jgi:hypothetical protein
MERSGGTIEHAIHAIHAIHAAAAAVAVAVAAIVAIRDIVGNVVQVGVWRRRAQPGLQGAAH